MVSRGVGQQQVQHDGAVQFQQQQSIASCLQQQLHLSCRLQVSFLKAAAQVRCCSILIKCGGQDTCGCTVSALVSSAPGLTQG